MATNLATFIDYQVTDRIARITISRPRAGNALNWPLLEQLRSAVARAVDAPGVEGVVITGAGNRFVCGADLGFFVRSLESGNVATIVECIRASQEVFAQIADCPKPVVAAVQGAAVGGGVELALASHRIVAAPGASFSFPETGLGILPFSGGTYRTPRRIGAALTKWLVYTGHALPPPKALQIGLIDELVMPESLVAAATAAALALRDDPTARRRPIADSTAEFTALRALFDRSAVSQLRRFATAQPPGNRTVAAALRALAGRSPVVLEWAEKLIDSALTGTAEAGADAALEAVPPLFNRRDVLERMIRVAGQQRPSSLRHRGR